MMHRVMAIGLMMTVCAAAAFAADSAAVVPVPFTAVKIDSGFWSARMETNRTVTVPYCFKKCEETGRISNFTKAGKGEGKFEGIYFNDSDLYKVIEGAAYSLQIHPDPELEKYVDGVIEQIASAQWDDGYLYTFYSLPHDTETRYKQPEKRWTNEREMHETYCAGHFFEAAVAYSQATGKKRILEVACRLADHMDRVFGPGKQYDTPGHEEAEIGLVKLYRATGNEKYLKLAEFFLDQRGNSEHRKLYGDYCQDHMPIAQQTEAVGHAVRAGYLYTGMADVSAILGRPDLRAALGRIWEGVASQKMYLTGGIGSSAGGEAFGAKYELPNKSAYNETCAAIANALWNHRMYLMDGDARYIDILERVIYNGFLSGVSMSGDRFFYPNPLASDAGYQRSEWFGCSCCPVNVVRFIPSILGYMYGVRDDSVFVNLFIGGSAAVETKSGKIRLTQKTNYPWDGRVEIAVDPEKESEFSLRLRIPGWAQNRPVPSDLYQYVDSPAAVMGLAINGKQFEGVVDKGFAVIRRDWKAGDRVVLELPMPVRRVLAHEKVADDKGRVAMERGPVVYCLEGVDNGGVDGFDAFVLNDDAKLNTEFRKDLLNGVQVITGQVQTLQRTKSDAVEAKQREFTAIPYYAWAHRGPSAMAVWLPRTKDAATVEPLPTIASKSKVSVSFKPDMENAQPKSVQDQRVPKNSGDNSFPHFHWWSHKGSTEWIQYDLAERTKVTGCQVYWFDDTGQGECRVPKSWRILYRAGSEWKPVAGSSAYGVAKDAVNAVTFEVVETDGLRLEVQLQDGFSGGVYEWVVDAGTP
jgi:DUF1680 family protein